jgi:hypothetical protein
LSDLQHQERECPTSDIYSDGPKANPEPCLLHAKDAAVEQQNRPFDEEVDPGICDGDEEAKLEGSELSLSHEGIGNLLTLRTTYTVLGSAATACLPTPYLTAG